MNFNPSFFRRAGQSALLLFAVAAAVVGYRQWAQTRPVSVKPGTAVEASAAQGETANSLAGPQNPVYEFPAVSPADREYLLSVYRDTWNYIADFVEPTTGLPYDSNKKQPATSVSNIGLYLGSTAIAYRTGLISKEESLRRIHSAFESLKKLETWRGFPRVWTAVRSLKAIHGTETFSYSKHVANLIGGLTLMQTIFPEELNQEVGSYLRGMQFKDMYDAGTGWVKGGYDLQHQNFAVNQPFGPWHYKYLASESRLISYYLIARGFAPTSHWNSLVRTIQNGNGDWFMVPGLEDGGAYMPYMAGLYVDERDMLIGESQKNYTHSSMEHAKEIGAPVWGWSASLDTRGEYTPYGQLKDELVAPYASMLAVHYFPNEVVANLKALEKMGARPETEAKKTTEFPGAFADERAVLTAPSALVYGGNVFLIDRDGALLPLKNYLDSGLAGKPVEFQGTGALAAFFEGLNEPVFEGRPVEELVESAVRGTGLSTDLKILAGSPQSLQTLLALAVRTGEYQFGEIRLKDGTVLKTVWRDDKEQAVPEAIVYQKDLYVLNAAGLYDRLKTPVDNRDAKSVVTAYAQDRMAYAAAAAGLAAEFKKGGAILTPGSRFPSSLSAEAAALAAGGKDYQPAKLTLSNGQILEIALGIPGVQWSPWAAAENGEVYFLNREGLIEKLSPYIKKMSASRRPYPYDASVLDTLLKAAQISLAAGPLPASPADTEPARRSDFINPEILNVLSLSETLSDLLALAVSTGLYQPGQVRLADGAEYPVLWSQGNEKNVPWAIASESDVFFISDHGKIESLKKYLSKTTASSSFDERAALRFFESAGLRLRGKSKGLPAVKNIVPGRTVLSSLSEQIHDPEMRAALLGLAARNGLYSAGAVQLSDGAELSTAWVERPVTRDVWAAASSQEVVFKDPAQGLIKTMTSYLDQSRINQPVANLDRRTLAVFAEQLGFKPAEGLSAEDFFKNAYYGTLVKPELLKAVTEVSQRQSLLGLTAKAALYTPAKIELEDSTTAFLLLKESQGVLTAAAAAKDGKVYFLGRDRQVHALRDYESKRGEQASTPAFYERVSLEVLAANLNFQLREGDQLKDQVESLRLGTLQSSRLEDALADAAVLPELEALAVVTDITEPAVVQLKDGRSLWVALGDSRSRWVPYAAGGAGSQSSGVSFVSPDGLSLPLADYLDMSEEGKKTKAYDRAALKSLLVKAGVSVKGPAPEAVLGTFVKDELKAQAGSPQRLRELLAVAAKAGLYKPGFVDLKEEGVIPVLFTKKGDTYQPWAIERAGRLYFFSKKGTLENLNSAITKEPSLVVASGSEPQTSEFLSGKASPQVSYQASRQNQLDSASVDSRLSSLHSAELLGLAASTGIYEPVRVKLTESRLTNYGFHDSVNWKTGEITPYYLTPSQGMAFLSLANFLYDGVVWKAFSANTKMKTALDKLREIDKTQDLLGVQAQRGCMLLPKTQTRAA